MTEVAWQEFTKSGALTTKRKSVNAENVEKFIEKLAEKDSFYQIIGISE